MNKIIVTAVAAFLALAGAIAQAEGQTAPTAVAPAETDQFGTVSNAERIKQVLLSSEWLIIIHQFPTASKHLRGLTTFSVLDGKLTARVIDRNTPTTMGVDLNSDGTVVLISSTGSKIYLKQKDDGFEGVSVTTSGREYQVSAQRF